jgi:hypothetical protein
MTKKSNPPSINEQAFDCPHCGAYTTQYWFDVLSDRIENNAPPSIPGSDIRELLKQNDKIPEDVKNKHLEWCDKMDTGLIFFGERKTNYPNYKVKGDVRAERA